MIRSKLQAARERRAKRALDRQLAYQREKASKIDPEDAIQFSRNLTSHAQSLKSRLESFRNFTETDRILEVGSGAHGHAFFIDQPNAIGVDPLAGHYRSLLPYWQSRATSVIAFGEQLPFEDSCFDVVISDNVVDHAQEPQRIVQEMIRVLAPGGLLYFTVHVHHQLYWLASHAQLLAFAMHIPIEVGPFADHTVHFRVKDADRLFDSLPIERLQRAVDIEETLSAARQTPSRHLGDRLKRIFFKNATFTFIGRRLS